MSASAFRESETTVRLSEKDRVGYLAVSAAGVGGRTVACGAPAHSLCPK